MTLQELQAIRERDAADLRAIADGYTAFGQRAQDCALVGVCREQRERLLRAADKLSGESRSHATSYSNSPAQPESAVAPSTRHECASSLTGILKPFATDPAGCATPNHVAGTTLKEAA